MQESAYGKLRTSAAYQLTEAELSRVFDRAYAGHAGKLRLIVQSLLMAVVGILSLIDFIAITPHRGMSLFIAIAALVVGVAQWLVMPFFRRSSVKQQLEEHATIHLSIYEKGIGFGEGERRMMFAFDSCHLIEDPDILILKVNQEFVGIPNRVLSEDDRLFLTEWLPKWETK